MRIAARCLVFPLLLVALALGCSRDAQVAVPPPNVAVFLIDTLRPDALGVYGNPTEPAPFLAELAARSAVFAEAHAASTWTAPSTASLFLSAYPFHHGVVEGFRLHRRRVAEEVKSGATTIEPNRMPASAETMPEWLRRFGYRTFGVAANINIGPEIGFDRGFDWFVRDHGATGMELADLLDEHAGAIAGPTPYFLYVHLNDVHEPYDRRDPYYRAPADPAGDDRARYVSEIGYVDAAIRRIYERFGMDENTVVFVLSDHGEEFGDHGRHGHKPTLYRELERVVFIASGPGVAESPRRIDANVSLLDVLPTLAERIGAPARPAWEGVSLMPLLRGGETGAAQERALADRLLYAHRVNDLEAGEVLWSAIRGPWKRIDYWGTRAELFNDRTDPQEKTDLAADNPDIAADLARALAAVQAEAKKKAAAAETVEVPVDQELKDELQALGYVN